MEQFYNKKRIIGNVDIWLAHWTENPSYKSKYNYGQVMWQWGLDKSLNGGVDGDLCFVDYPARAAEFYEKHGIAVDPPVIPETPAPSVNTSDNIKIGDVVQFKGGSVYVSSTAKNATATKGASVCVVTNIYSKGTHKYHLKSTDGKGVYGWVNATDIQGAEIANPTTPTNGAASEIKVGDVVQFKGGSVYVSSAAEKSTVTRGASRCKVTILQSGGNKCPNRTQQSPRGYPPRAFCFHRNATIPNKPFTKM